MSALSLHCHDRSERYSRCIREYCSPVGKRSSEGEIAWRRRLGNDCVLTDPEQRFSEETMDPVENSSLQLVLEEAFGVSGIRGLSWALNLEDILSVLSYEVGASFSVVPNTRMSGNSFRGMRDRWMTDVRQMVGY